MIKSFYSDLIEAVEEAAIASAKWRGKGQEKSADQAAVDAMRRVLKNLDADAMVVIGEGERDEAPMLYIGEKMGNERSPIKIDIAVDPLEGTTICAHNEIGSLSVLAVAPQGGFLHAPDMHMKKIAVGPAAAEVIDLDKTPADNVMAVAEVLRKPVSEITVAVLDRPRHEDLIAELRRVGVRVRLFRDGDVSKAIETCLPESPVDLLMGVGGSPEGVLAAAAIKNLGGGMQGRLVVRKSEERERAQRMNLEPDRKLTLDDMVKGEAWFFATGVTPGELLQGIEFNKNDVTTHTLVISSQMSQIQYLTRRRKIQT